MPETPTPSANVRRSATRRANAKARKAMESLKIDGPKKHVTEECGPDCLSGCAVCS